MRRIGRGVCCAVAVVVGVCEGGFVVVVFVVVFVAVSVVSFAAAIVEANVGLTLLSIFVDMFVLRTGRLG